MLLQDVRQTAEYTNFMSLQGWQIGSLQCKKLPAQYFYKKVGILPLTLCKILRFPYFIPLSLIRQIRKKHHCLYLQQEPFIYAEKLSQGIIEFNYINPWMRLTPSKTLWLNLNLSLEKLKNQFKARTRYNLKRTYQKFQLQIRTISGEKITPQNLQDFYNLLAHNRPYSKMFPADFEELKNLIHAFANKCFLVFVYADDYGKSKLVAVSLILTSGNMAFYWHNASSLLGKQVYAPTRAIWQAILEAKKRNLQTFDFEGLYDLRFPRLNKGWQGFSRFKLGFYKVKKE